MTDWSTIRKLEALAPVVDGISSVARLIPRGSGTGLALGTCDFQPGTIAMDVGNPEAFVVLAGSLSATTDGATVTARAGEALWMPAGASLQITAHEATRVVYIIREGA